MPLFACVAVSVIEREDDGGVGDSDLDSDLVKEGLRLKVIVSEPADAVGVDFEIDDELVQLIDGEGVQD